MSDLPDNYGKPNTSVIAEALAEALRATDPEPYMPGDWEDAAYYRGFADALLASDAVARIKAEGAAELRARIEALHRSSQATRGVGRYHPDKPGNWWPYCDECGDDWPCPTIAALDGADQ